MWRSTRRSFAPTRTKPCNSRHMSCQWSWITSSILERNEVNKVLMAVSHLTAGATFLTYQMTRSCRRPLIRHPSHPNRGSPEAIHPNPSFIRIATFEGIVSYLMGSYGDNHDVYIYICVYIYIVYWLYELLVQYVQGNFISENAEYSCVLTFIYLVFVFSTPLRSF